MKFPRFVLPLVLLFLSPVAFAQSDMHDHKAVDNPAPKSDAPKPVAPKSEAQKSFETIKALAGTWDAKLTITPPIPDMDDNTPSQISMRVTSRGNALVHEMYAVGKADDPSRYDHPLTMFYLDGDRLTLVHYCDAGNRPRMVARTSPDGKTVEFDFVDISGSTQTGHMHHGVFTIIDANHHTEDWIYMLPGDKPMHAHFDLTRTKTGSGAGW
jgi:hypothetical protein